MSNAGLLYKDYSELYEFAMDVYGDISAFLDDCISRMGAEKVTVLTGAARSVPLLTRAESYSERLGDVHIDIAVPSGSPEYIDLDIRLTLNTNITTTIDETRLTNIILIASDGSLVAVARFHEANRFNAITFGAIRVRSEMLRHSLVIKGVRADAAFLGVSSTIATNYIMGLIEVSAISPVAGSALIVHQQMILGLVQRSFGSASVAKSALVQMPGGWQRQVDVFTSTIEFRGFFAGSFRTKEQEGESSIGSALAALVAHVPAGWLLFATRADLGSQAYAMAIPTDANGNVGGQSTGSPVEMPALLWNARIPMVRIEENGLICWEITEPSAGFGAVTLTFGLALVAPRGAFPPAEPLQVAMSRAPFYTTAAAHMPSRTLPIPRFSPGVTLQNVLWTEADMAEAQPAAYLH